MDQCILPVSVCMYACMHARMDNSDVTKCIILIGQIMYPKQILIQMACAIFFLSF